MKEASGRNNDGGGQWHRVMRVALLEYGTITLGVPRPLLKNNSTPKIEKSRVHQYSFKINRYQILHPLVVCCSGLSINTFRERQI